MRTLRRVRHRTRWPLVALLALVVALGVGYAVRAADHHSSRSAHVTSAPLSSLPPQAARTVDLIRAGGPYPYPEDDGIVFHNYEHLLPAEPDGYYREYTVPTPGAPDRGSRRIVTGHGGQVYYTGDHYGSFVRVETSR